ncbi:hypothetical protein [Loktanella sp. S4079]|uniref:hypothetical protein n=1 Tax=Loktanella sp. S4079 TaxID=579483 RepID=UPI00406C165B
MTVWALWHAGTPSWTRTNIWFASGTNSSRPNSMRQRVIGPLAVFTFEISEAPCAIIRSLAGCWLRH